MSVIENDHGAYESFGGSINALPSTKTKTEIKRIDASTIEQVRLSLTMSGMAAAAKKASVKAATKGAKTVDTVKPPPMRKGNYGLSLPPNTDFYAALCSIGRVRDRWFPDDNFRVPATSSVEARAKQ